ncbi:MAG: MFS transporter [Cellvibrionales bacterium]|nr:MFS transporter [Cellvibrionales bacterium]
MQNQDTMPISGWRRSLNTLNIRQFRWLMAGNAAFFLAMQGQVLTRTFLAWDLTQEEMSLAYINIAFAIPMLIFSLLGGAMSDRIERRKLIIIGQLILLANECTVMGLLIVGSLEFWNLLIAGVIAGVFMPFIMPARTALVYGVVGPNKLGNAMALSSAVQNLSRILGPAMMGFAISLYSTVGAYIIAVTLYSTSVLCMFGIHRNKNSHGNTVKPKLSQDVLAGIMYVKSYRPLLICILFGLVPMLLAMPFQNFLVVFADQVWAVGERGLGMLMGMSGLGGVIGSIWVAQRGERIDRTKLMALNALLFGMLIIIFSLTSNFYLALIPLVFASACGTASQTLNNTTTQLLVDDNQRGRTSSLMMMAYGLTPLGVLPMAFLAQHIGVQWATITGCVTLVFIITAFYWQSKTLKTLDQAVKDKLNRLNA